MKYSAPVRIDLSGGWPDSDPYRKDFGGSVLNAAINLRVEAKCDEQEWRFSTQHVPGNSGLGTSGALRSLILVTSNPYILNDRLDLIRQVHIYENQVIRQRAGYQDQAAAIYGGLNFWEFGPHGSIKRTPLEKDIGDFIEQRISLVHTGKSHLSSNIHDLVFGPGNYERNIPALDLMKKYSEEMMQNVTNESYFAELMQSTWNLQKSLHSSIETDTMRAIQEAANGKYLACKATGAGGGGCMIFYNNNRFILDSFFRDLFNEIGFYNCSVLDFKIDYAGLIREK